MPTTNIFLALTDAAVLDLLQRSVLTPAGYRVIPCLDEADLVKQLGESSSGTLILDDGFTQAGSLDLSRRLGRQHPALSILLLTNTLSQKLMNDAMQHGLVDVLTPPLKPREVLAAVERAQERAAALNQWTQREARLATQSLQQRITDMEALAAAGRAVTASLDLDSILTRIVNSAVELTGAQAGSLWMVDKDRGELYPRTVRNLEPKLIEALRLHLDDSLAGQAVRTGEPLKINQTKPLVIQGEHQVYSIIYVPLRSRSGVTGLLEVNQGVPGKPFEQSHLALLTALAGYASIAIENANLHALTVQERGRFERILTHVEDCVIVVSPERTITFMNPSARQTFAPGLVSTALKPVADVVQHPDLLQIFHLPESGFPLRRELALEDGRILNAQCIYIEKLGIVATMQDITQLKEMDRIKSEFVSTVSHDIRSPLTAILGYAGLLEKVGPLNDLQRQFVERIHASMAHITMLINELLDLGKIEAGFDSQKELVLPGQLIEQVVDELGERAAAKGIILHAEIEPDLPQILASPTRIQQMLANLINNAIKYTPAAGTIHLHASAADDQLFLQVTDTGVGIPLAEQPYIFDRFYRASNTMGEPGTGLGLAIVKSIVENHQGRIWVESTPGKGTTFTTILPVFKN